MQRSTTVIAVICCLFLFLGLMPVHGESEIYDSVLRLHVIANSDSDEDQELKLKVRDALLQKSETLFGDCATREEAIKKTAENLKLLKAEAAEVIRSEGYTYEVSVELGEEVYPTKNYEEFCFPSGSYMSLRIIIGNGEGQNWWCVLFPPMCLSAASTPDPEDAFISVGLSKEQYGIITETEYPTYNVRFRILEVIEETLR
ncbi:MAG: stage II sporulation protein R [Clostridia bacterium]|nr:stage II sporulation protein R [Clostridia bacterium]